MSGAEADRGVASGGGVPEGDRDLDWLDEAYLKAQDRVAEAIARDDTEAAASLFAASALLSVDDAEGASWQIAQPNRSERSPVQPYYRFSFRYTKQGMNGQTIWTRRTRFSRSPSLARMYAERVGGTGLLALLVKHSEPIGYVAAGIVGFGLWLMLGDIIGLLSGVAIVAGVALLAAALWVGHVLLGQVSFREAERLSAILGAAAIGVTGAVPWLATFESDVTDVGRVALTAGVVTAAAVSHFHRSRSAFPYFAALAAFLVTAGSAPYAIVDAADSGSPSGMSVQLGILIAVIALFPIATRLAVVRWIPATVVLLTGAGSLAALIMDGSTVSTTRLVIVSLCGLAASASAWTSASPLTRPLRIAHKRGAAVLALATLVVVLSYTDWDFLADIPLPITLVAIGSILLVAIATAIRIAVRRLNDKPPATD